MRRWEGAAINTMQDKLKDEKDTLDKYLKNVCPSYRPLPNCLQSSNALAEDEESAFVKNDIAQKPNKKAR